LDSAELRMQSAPDVFVLYTASLKICNDITSPMSMHPMLWSPHRTSLILWDSPRISMNLMPPINTSKSWTDLSYLCFRSFSNKEKASIDDSLSRTSPYHFFTLKIKSENPNLSFNEVSKLAKNLWKTSPDNPALSLMWEYRNTLNRIIRCTAEDPSFSSHRAFSFIPGGEPSSSLMFSPNFSSPRMILYVLDVRLDLSSNNIILDSCISVLSSKKMVDKMGARLSGFTFGFSDLTKQQSWMWSRVIPSGKTRIILLTIRLSQFVNVFMK
jgi:hypothetical protein